MREKEFWRGQNLGLGWNDPTFGTHSVAKVTRGVVPAHKEEVGIVFARAQCSEHAACNARCNASMNDERRSITWHF